MNRTNYILALIFAILLIMIFFAAARQRQPASPTPLTQSGLTPTKSSSFATKTNSEGSVSMEVTPTVLQVGERPKFQVSFNTHSVELDFNIEDIVTLADDRGNLINSPKWVGSPLGGHHRSGELNFDQTLNQDTRRVTLTFKNVAGIPSRVFSWDLP